MPLFRPPPIIENRQWFLPWENSGPPFLGAQGCISRWRLQEFFSRGLRRSRGRKRTQSRIGSQPKSPCPGDSRRGAERAEKNISWGSGSRPDRHSVATADEGEPSQL